MNTGHVAVSKGMHMFVKRCVCGISRYPDILIRFSCLDFPCWLSSIFQLSASCFNAYIFRHSSVSLLDTKSFEAVTTSNERQPVKATQQSIHRYFQQKSVNADRTLNPGQSRLKQPKSFRENSPRHLRIKPTCHQSASFLLDINWHTATAPEPRRFHLIAQPVWFMFFQTLFGFDTFLFSHLTADWKSVPQETCAGWEVSAFLHNGGTG